MPFATPVTGQLEQALVQAEHLRGMVIEEDDAWWLPFWFDYPPEGLSGAMVQRHVTGAGAVVLRAPAPRHRRRRPPRAAEKVFQSYRRLGRKRPDRRRPWVAYVADGGYLWLEHYPNARPDHVLNAHLHSLIGLYEYWQHTRSPEARQLLEGALTTMRDRAATYRREGRVSIYGLRSRTNHYKYHQVHIWQLRLLGRMTGDPFFSELADALAADKGPKRDVSRASLPRAAPGAGPQPLAAGAAAGRTTHWSGGRPLDRQPRPTAPPVETTRPKGRALMSPHTPALT